MVNICNNRNIPISPPSRGNVIKITSRNREKGLKFSPDTSVPQWYGDEMDESMAVEMLLGYE